MANPQKFPSLPSYIVIDFPSYDGPNFFNDDEKRNWVILKSETVTWNPNHKYDDSHNRCSIQQYPIRLASAWTLWKAQGSTFSGKFTLNLGDNEKEHSLSYVVFSRATNINNILLPQGIP